MAIRFGPTTNPREAIPNKWLVIMVAIGIIATILVLSTHLWDAISKSNKPIHVPYFTTVKNPINGYEDLTVSVNLKGTGSIAAQSILIMFCEKQSDATTLICQNPTR